MNDNDKEVIGFILKSIETLSLAILTDDYDVREIEEMYQGSMFHNDYE